MGMWTDENICGGLSGVSLAIFNRASGWSKDETEAFLVKVGEEVKDTKIHSYVLM